MSTRKGTVSDRRGRTQSHQWESVLVICMCPLRPARVHCAPPLPVSTAPRPCLCPLRPAPAHCAPPLPTAPCLCPLRPAPSHCTLPVSTAPRPCPLHPAQLTVTHPVRCAPPLSAVPHPFIVTYLSLSTVPRPCLLLPAHAHCDLPWSTVTSVTVRTECGPSHWPQVCVEEQGGMHFCWQAGKVLQCVNVWFGSPWLSVVWVLFFT